MCAFTFHMKKFAIMLLGVIFVVLLSGSVESISADHLLPGEGVFKNENDVNIASYFVVQISKEGMLFFCES